MLQRTQAQTVTGRWQGRNGHSPDNGKEGGLRPWYFSRLSLGVGAGALLLAGAVVGGIILQPHRQTYQAEIVQVQKLIDQGKTKSASDLAEGYLSNNNATAEAEVALATLGREAGIQELYKHPEVGLQAVPVWQGLEDEADKHHVPKEKRSPLTVFTYSYTSGMYDLAAASFIVGWKWGLAEPSSREDVGKYYATKVNQALALLEKGDRRERDRGLEAMATAAAISKAYDMVGRGEAAHYLATKFGEDEAMWPQPDKHDLVLNKTIS